VVAFQVTIQVPSLKSNWLSFLAAGYVLGYISCLVVVWNPLSLDGSDGVFGRSNLAALLPT